MKKDPPRCCFCLCEGNALCWGISLFCLSFSCWTLRAGETGTKTTEFFPFIKGIFYQALTLQLCTSCSISISLSYHKERLYSHNLVTLSLPTFRYPPDQRGCFAGKGRSLRLIGETCKAILSLDPKTWHSFQQPNHEGNPSCRARTWLLMSHTARALFENCKA